MLSQQEFNLLVEIRDLLRIRKCRCSVGKRYSKSKTMISKNTSYTEANREYPQGEN